MELHPRLRNCKSFCYFPPAGDGFDIDYVVHEIGHQMGATHTFTFSAETGSTSQMEPGSGITIMGYAGITNQDDSSHSIASYHAISISQIQANLAAKTCPVTTTISATNATLLLQQLAIIPFLKVLHLYLQVQQQMQILQMFLPINGKKWIIATRLQVIIV